MPRTVLFRLAAILIGVSVTLLAVEATLRIIAWTVAQTHEPVDRGSLVGELRITCVGESTTFGRWPSQLEEILNGAPDGPRVRVINRGDVGILTAGVADRIGGWLDEDKPHLVITMRGIIDEGNVLVYGRDEDQPWVSEHVMAARLVNLLWRSTFNVGIPEVQQGPLVEPPEGDTHVAHEIRPHFATLGQRRADAMRSFRYSEAIDIERELITLDPGTPFYLVGLLKDLTLHHESPERLDEFFRNEVDIDSAGMDEDERRREIAKWAERTGDRFAGLRLAVSTARLANDPDLERRLLEDSTADPEIAGLAWLRWAEFATMWERPEMVEQCLRRADQALPDDYQWSLLLSDISFTREVYDLVAENLEKALRASPELPTSHEQLILGWLATAYEQSGALERAAEMRALRDELGLDRFREFTRYHYRRVIDAVRAREIAVIAMQYPLLSVESLRKLLDNREDVTYLGNRSNFEAALRRFGYGTLFSDSFAGSFGHFTDRGNRLVAENVAGAVAELMPELALQERTVTDPP